MIVEISEIRELHYITHIDNLPSIFRHGILCHRDAQKLKPISVADSQVQARRAQKRVPGGLLLHDYVNLYINGRNPMLYRNCKDFSDTKLAVLSVSTEVMKTQGVVLTDGNAAASRTAFSPYPMGLKKLDRELIYARYWNDPDPIVKDRKTWAICAEVLVPSRLDPQVIEKLYVASGTVMASLSSLITAPVIEHAYLFFRT
jgi:hypothetical protein